MKLKELMAALRPFEEKDGDLEVRTLGDGYSDVSSIEKEVDGSPFCHWPAIVIYLG